MVRHGICAQCTQQEHLLECLAQKYQHTIAQSKEKEDNSLKINVGWYPSIEILNV